MNMDPASRARIDEFRKRTKALPKTENLPELSTMDGFADWLNSPITRELLVRIESKCEDYRADADKMRPCASCKKDDPEVDKEYRGWLAGAADLLHAVAQVILAGQTPRCGHDAVAEQIADTLPGAIVGALEKAAEQAG